MPTLPTDFSIVQHVFREEHEGFQIVAFINARGGMCVDVKDGSCIVWTGANILDARAWIDERAARTLANRLFHPDESALILKILTANGESFDAARKMMEDAREHVANSEAAAVEASSYYVVGE
jgi:hypothetical protein